MELNKTPSRGLSGNALKILAALFMVCDHIGMLFFPVMSNPMPFRYIGRLAFPIFAFFIAEGCRYTKNRARYLGTLAVMGIVFHLVYFSATGDDTVNVLVSFALAVGVIYLWQNFVYLLRKKKILSLVSLALFGLYASLCYALCKAVHVDYLFFGIMLPWLVYLFKNKWLKLFCFALGIVLVAYGMGKYMDIEQWGLCAVPVMTLYNGERGWLRMKYFFYLFYPIHIVVLYGISLLVLGA